MKIGLALSAALALFLHPDITDAKPLSIFDQLPEPHHLRQVEDPDAFLKYHTRSFVQVASSHQSGDAAVISDRLRRYGLEPEVYLYQSERQKFYVTMIMVTSREQLDETMDKVRRLGHRDAYMRNYSVPR